jgi:hypothetical protein
MHSGQGQGQALRLAGRCDHHQTFTGVKAVAHRLHSCAKHGLNSCTDVTTQKAKMHVLACWQRSKLICLHVHHMLTTPTSPRWQAGLPRSPAREDAWRCCMYVKHRVEIPSAFAGAANWPVLVNSFHQQQANSHQRLVVLAADQTISCVFAGSSIGL